MTVQEFLYGVEETTIITVYGRDRINRIQHRGTFNLGDETALGELFSNFGDAPVVKHDKYKGWLSVYLA